MLRDFLRRRRLARHVRRHGWVFPYAGVDVSVPREIDLAVTNALIKGTYEASEIQLIQKFLPPAKAVIELGGSLGVVSAVIEQKLAPGTTHLIVEANPHLLEVCAENAGGSPGLQIEGCAVHYDGPEVVLHLADNPHAGMVSDSGQSALSVTVPARTLADLHAAIGAPQEFSLVCDIEGAELNIVEHDQVTLKQAGLIIMELHPAFMPPDALDIVAVLQALGFEKIAEIADVVALQKR